MYKLELTEKMIDIIGEALGAQPYNRVAPVVTELQRQINANLMAAKKQQEQSDG